MNGTEPILIPEYYELYKENSQNRILTNGLELIRNPDLYDILKENGINEIALSYHFGIQDDISAVKSSMLDGLIENLVENGFQVKLMTTISSDNYKMISTMCSKAYELGAKTIKFTNYIYQGNAQKNDFTIYRNIMNTATIRKAGSEVLGTLFIDISADYLKKMLTQESYGTNHEIYVVDSASGKYIYHSQKQYEGINAQNDGILLDAM